MDAATVGGLAGAGGAVVASALTYLALRRNNAGTVNTSDAKTVLDSIHGALTRSDTALSEAQRYFGIRERDLLTQLDAAREANDGLHHLLIDCQTVNGELTGTIMRLHAETTASELIEKAQNDAAKLRAEARTEATKVIIDSSAASHQVLATAAEAAVALADETARKEVGHGDAPS